MTTRSFGFLCALSLLVTVATYAILYNLKLLPGYGAIICAPIPILLAGLLATGLGQWNKALAFLGMTCAAGIATAPLLGQQMISLLFWWEEPSQAGKMFLTLSGYGFLTVLACIRVLWMMDKKVSSNWATITLLILGVIGLYYGFTNDLSRSTILGFGKINSFWGSYEYGLEGYVIADGVAIAMIFLALFSPSPDHEKWLEWKRKMQADATARLRDQAIKLETQAAELRRQATNAQ